MKTLTRRQQQVLELIGQSIIERSYPPTVRELGDALDIGSTNGVNVHLEALVRKAMIERTPIKSRAIRMTAAGWNTIGRVDPHLGIGIEPQPPVEATRPGLVFVAERSVEALDFAA